MSGKSTMKNFKEMLGGAQLPEKVVRICLRGDLVAELEETEAALEEEQARIAVLNSLDGGGQVSVLAQKIETLRDQMRGQSYDFRLRALRKADFRALMGAHPPRETEDGGVDPRDRKSGMNMETFVDDLVRQSVVDPQLDADDWAALDEKLTDRQFEALFEAAWYLNRGDIDVPFSSAASLINRNSAPE